MNEVWMRIFKDWVETYEAINKIERSLIEEEDACKLKYKLLGDIIETLKTEVEE